MSEPTSSACIYTESSGPEDASEQRTSLFVDDARGDGRHSEVVSDSFSRPLSERYLKLVNYLLLLQLSHLLVLLQCPHFFLLQ